MSTIVWVVGGIGVLGAIGGLVNLLHMTANLGRQERQSAERQGVLVFPNGQPTARCQ